jgi:hypothetical protein
MKKIVVLFILIACGCSFTNAQNTFPIKEAYDQVLEPNYTSWPYHYNNTSVPWWQSWGWNLLSYLRMYQTTGDKAYLNKFVKHSYGVQLRRGTDAIWNGPMNYDDPTIVLYTGQLLRPMAEFIYIVKNDMTLYNTNLLSGFVPGTLYDPTYTILGYGDYANWLQARVIQSMDYMLQYYWINNSYCFSNSLSGSSPIEINFNASYASTMFYIGSVEPISYSDYTFKAEQIVTFFRNRVTEYIPNHSYTWFHKDDPHCYLNSLPCREDVVHGAIDLQIPLVAYQLYGNGLYQPSEMNKFARTFTQNIWNTNNGFHNSVFGMDYEISADQNSCSGAIPANGSTNFYGPGEVLCWMPLYHYDDLNPNPTDIYYPLLIQTIKLLNNDPSAIVPLPTVGQYCHMNTLYLLSGTISFYGLSEVVKAQWDKECVNLTLYNRDIVYNQDFIVKNRLKVAPQQDEQRGMTPNTYYYYQAGINAPFADPITFADSGPLDRFLVESGKAVNMIAGESIELLPGFEAKFNSNFKASIVPNNCTDGTLAPPHNPPPPPGNNPINPSTLDAQRFFQEEATDIIQRYAELRINIYPNPNSGIFELYVPSLHGNTYNLEITDILGKTIWQSSNNFNKVLKLDISSNPKGIYFVKVVQGGKIAVKKIIYI